MSSMSADTGSSGHAMDAEESGARTPGLRLLGQDDLLPGEPPRNLGRRTAGDHTTGHEEQS